MPLTVLAALLLVAVITDIRTRRISNRLILAGMSIALLLSSTFSVGPDPFKQNGGSVEVLQAIAGIAVGFAALFPLYALRAMGAGDVKLMMMVGAFLGPLQTLGVVVLTFAAGGVLALAMALWQRSFTQLAMNLRFMLTTSMVRAAGGQSPRLDPLATTAGRMPYAVAIAAGTLLQFLLVRSGGWAFS